MTPEVKQKVLACAARQGLALHTRPDQAGPRPGFAARALARAQAFAAPIAAEASRAA